MSNMGVAGASHRQAELTATIAESTRLQAETTQQMFEAAHRPYIEFRLLENGIFIDAAQFSLEFNVMNHGSVPATNLAWTVTVRQGDQTLVTRESTVTRVLYPQRDRNFAIDSGRPFAIQQSPQGIRIDASIRYCSARGREYVTTFIVERGDRGVWRVIHYEST